MSARANAGAIPHTALQPRRVRLASEDPPIVLSVLSTEEEFDWLAPFARAATSVAAVRNLHLAQSMFDHFGVRPAYLMDYPIANQATSAAPILEFLRAGRCEIGAHLHPWVSPPFDEPVTTHNSFPGNLAPALEEAKLRVLADTIERNFGERPRVYQAGRYGFGERTAAALARLGFEVDLSASPPFDFRAEGGPDFSALAPEPFWLAGEQGVLSVPITGAYVGWLRRGAHVAHEWSRAAALRWTKLAAVLARLGAVERLRLSPEGFSHDDHRRLTRFLLDNGVRVFVFSFHSPSLLPGCTPYVRSERELEVFLDTCRRFYDFFLGELGGRAMTPLELRRHLEARAPAGVP